MKEKIIEILSQEINRKLVEDLVNSYTDVKDTHIRGDDESAISKAGKFVENVFRVLKFILNKQILPEIKQFDFTKISEDLKNANSSKFPDSVRLLIPKIALSLIYEPRSKSGAVHQKQINPDFIDGKLVVNASDWILAELLRLYHTRDSEEVNKIIQNIVKEYIPIIQKIGDEKFVNAKVTCDDEILIRLFDDGDSGLSRKELGESMKRHFEPSTITNSIKKLEKDRDIHLTKSGRYVISEPAKNRIGVKIAELSATDRASKKDLKS